MSLHGPGGAFSLGIKRVSHLEGVRLDHQSGLRRALGGENVCPSHAPPQRALADRLHISPCRRVGLVLPLDGARRLLALRPGLDAAADDASDRCDGDVGPRAGLDRAPVVHRPRAGRGVGMLLACEVQRRLFGVVESFFGARWVKGRRGRGAYGMETRTGARSAARRRCACSRRAARWWSAPR